MENIEESEIIEETQSSEGSKNEKPTQRRSCEFKVHDDDSGCVGCQ